MWQAGLTQGWSTGWRKVWRLPNLVPRQGHLCVLSLHKCIHTYTHTAGSFLVKHDQIKATSSVDVLKLSVPLMDPASPPRCLKQEVTRTAHKKGLSGWVLKPPSCPAVRSRHAVAFICLHYTRSEYLTYPPFQDRGQPRICGAMFYSFATSDFD